MRFDRNTGRLGGRFFLSAFPKSSCRRTWFSIRFTFMPVTRTVTRIAKNWSGEVEADLADHWFVTTGWRSRPRSNPPVGSPILRACTSRAVPQEPGAHAGDSSSPWWPAALPTGFSALATFLPGSRYQGQDGPLGPEPAWTFSVAMNDEEALGVVSPESGLTREGHRSIRTAPASRLDLLCLASWKKRDRERREV